MVVEEDVVVGTGLALRGLDLEGLEGSGGGWIVYFVVMRVCGIIRLEGTRRGGTYGRGSSLEEESGLCEP